MGSKKVDAFDANVRSRVPCESRCVDRSARAPDRNGRGDDVAMDGTCDNDNDERERERDNQPKHEGRPQWWR
jgi:hypothetical protein